MANYIHFGVGQVIEEFRNNQDGPQFEMTDNGLLLLFFLNKPTDKEISQIMDNSSFEIRFTTIKDIIILSFKAGSFAWSDAPFSSHLSPPFDMSYPPEGMGLALNVIMIDSSAGEIKAIRVIALSNVFSRKLLDVIKKEKEKPFDEDEYIKNIDAIYKMCSTDEIVSMSKDYFRTK